MKKSNSNKVNKAQKIFTGGDGGEGDAYRLVGGIVEKGFSDQTKLSKPMGFPSAPQPTVLPFPVARHRSHGPHWSPLTTNNRVGAGADKDNEGDDDDDDDEEEYLSGLNFVSTFANPVQRKEKKGMNFSKWREIAINGNNSVSYKKEGNKRSVESTERSVDTSGKIRKHDGVSIKDDAEASVLPMADKNASAMEVDPTQNFDDLDVTLGNGIAQMKVDTIKETKFNSSELSSNTSNIASGTSLESQIDSENRAQLERMSADEIAEAQGDIMAKMRPELIQALRNRGQQKLKKQKASISDMTIVNEVSNVPKDNNTTKAEYKAREDINVRAKGNSLWDSWSKRVESVRDIRFSLDGNIVENDFTEVQSTGNASKESGYSANNVSERDFLRTEGDPGAVGYSIKEAIALCRSVVPGQRVLALHLIVSILNKALQDRVGSLDSEAIWAFLLGPEPELALTLRICLDDNHNIVVLACTKVIQCVLSCDVNERYFDILEKTSSFAKDVFTAPIFRSKPEINFGFLHGGFWKYNTKPSNIEPFAEEEIKGEELTIKDDVIVAGQDITAGLVRMGILQRILYLYENNPSGGLEESLISILVAIARHSPKCAAAIMNCERLVQTIVNRFIMIDPTVINPSKIRSVRLLKVLARVDKKNCMEFLEGEILQKMMWHLYRPASSIDQWVKSGKEACKLSSAMLVEQLRFWKVCIQHGYCISDFSDLFPALCIWLNPPEIKKLIDQNVLIEYALVAKEVCLVLASLTKRLPNFYSSTDQREIQETQSWCWSYVGPVIDLALEWTKVKNIPYLDTENSALLWVLSSVMHMLSCVLEAVIPENDEKVPWLPDFVPKIGLAITRNGLFSFSDINSTECDTSFLKSICSWRENKNGGEELSIASVCCIHGLVQVIVSVDKLIQLNITNSRDIRNSISRDDKILANGMVKSAQIELEYLLRIFTRLIDSEWEHVQSVEKFNRGGPAPGVGMGWGGGFFSATVLLARVDAKFIGYLLQIVSSKESFSIKETTLLPRINSAMEACLIACPGDDLEVAKILDFLFQVPVLRYLDSVISQFLHVKQAFKPFDWKYEEEEYLQFSSLLESHFKNRWLTVKKKKKALTENPPKTSRISLDTINEEEEVGPSKPVNQVQEWAHQRLPLPKHWYLSPISTVHLGKKSDHTEENEVVKSGLFFILATEAMTYFLASDFNCFVQKVPVVWKLHALSVILLNGMAVLEHEKSRQVFETLQDIYGQYINELTVLNFESEIHESYDTYIETLVEQLAGISYGDEIFGRQVALYLHRSVESSIRLATWNALSVTRALELLPPLDNCISRAHGYLEPVEDDERILEAYAKTWASDALDRSVDRKSAAFTVALHHLSSFIFQTSECDDKLSLRNRIVKSLLRDSSRKLKHKGMMLDLIQYKSLSITSSTPDIEMEKRFCILKDACEGNSSLLSEVKKLEEASIGQLSQ